MTTMEELSRILEQGLEHARAWDRQDLGRALEMTRAFERITIRAELSHDDLTSILERRETAGLLHLLVAYGAASIGDLMTMSLETENQDDGESAGEIGARLQAATAALARLGASR
jgi:hypothetical protein